MKRTNGLLIAAAVILGLAAIYWLIQGFGLLFTGAPFGTYSFYITLALIMVGLLLVGRKRSLLSGIIISALGILLAVYYLMIEPDIYTATPFLIFLCVPLAISGLLFIEADWSSRRKRV